MAASLSTRSSGRRAAAGRAAILVIAASAFTSSSALAAEAAVPDGGGAIVVSATARDTEINAGDETTEFSLSLPDGAACPGDSANDQWRVQSFIIPAAEDPRTIKYGTIGPEPVGKGHYAQFVVDTRPYVHQLTRSNLLAGQPGVIAPLPPLNFSVVAGERIPSGRYRIGVACTYFGATARFWDTEIVINASDDVGGRGLDWRLASVPEAAITPRDESTNWSIPVAAALAAAALAGLLWWRRARRIQPSSLTHRLTTSVPKEPS